MLVILLFYTDFLQNMPLPCAYDKSQAVKMGWEGNNFIIDFMQCWKFL